MTNGDATKIFLKMKDAKTRSQVITTIADHYGCSQEVAIGEITDEDAESLPDYLVGSLRAGVALLMRRRGLLA